MTGDMLMALTPMLIIGAIPLLLMAMVSIARSHRAAMLVTLAGFAAALLSVIGRVADSATTAPMQVTPLFQVDAIGLYFVGLFALGALATTLLSFAYLKGRTDQPEEYYMLLGTATLGAVAMALSAHFASFVLGLEVLSISLYGLISYPEEGNAPIEAAVKYLVLSGVASATLLFGMALVYAGCGSMSFADISARIALGTAADSSAALLTIGHAMILVAVAFKLSLVPFHMWTPDVYEGAPAPISGYLASVAKAAMLVLVLRYVAVTGVLEDPGLFNLVATLGVLSMVIGNLLALQQQNLKRLLAYSSIAHVGYLLIALPLVVVFVDGQNARVLAVEAAMIYLAVYVVTSIGAFAVVGLVSPVGTMSMRHELVHYRGLFWRQPVLASAFTVMLASLAGLPLTAGFIAKFYMISAGIQGRLWLLVWALILGSAIGAFYYLRVLMTLLATNDRAADALPGSHALPWVPLVTIALIGAVLLVLGVYPTPLIELAQHAMAIPLALHTGS